MKTLTSIIPIEILLVEDNEGDILLTKEAFEDSALANVLRVVRDGKEAINYVNRENGYEDVGLPDLLLLDINLPKKNGHEVLHHVKSTESLKHIPIIMLTTSSSERDINLAYNSHANCYITKPAELEDFTSMISKIENFWTTIVKLPIK
ncbi:response regulator [Pararcticibacter amylolyticus]|uniref:Response regulator n=1 Tax=Pararcticibacter amylolyticus TaxID=2173175 RepID=A0A2U2PKN2_9SPHI|nr:response regulator [Pararcticibacter amylolyticus]PWG81961.1 response regulator [Pararcticibacter amylolyticus]